ncbi:hypothetical protein N4G63_028155 (plasmid) [Aquabacterium sp. OR-4]|nr:hypothetical protein [Aquabacterium sp. OR-4]MDT7839080.1 hypothetical protein [Aquabacterium sp. OR-4]
MDSADSLCEQHEVARIQRIVGWVQRSIQRQEHRLLGRANPLLRALRPIVDSLVRLTHYDVRTALSGCQQRVTGRGLVNQQESPCRRRNETPVAVGLGKEVIVVRPCAPFSQYRRGIGYERFDMANAHRKFVNGTRRCNTDLAVRFNVGVADCVCSLRKCNTRERPRKLPVDGHQQLTGRILQSPGHSPCSN